MSQTILVLGAGVGGLLTANRLRGLLPRAHRVLLVDRDSESAFAPSLLWVMTGARTRAQITRPVARLARRGIELVRGEVERIDPVRREVTVGDRTLAADFLVIALGAELDPKGIPGLAAAGHNFYSGDGAEALARALDGFRGGHIVVLTAAPAYKCPAAPYEAAMLLQTWSRARHLRDRTTISLYAAEPGPMGVAGPAVSAAVRGMVEAKGIAYHPEHQVTRVDPASRQMEFANGVRAGFDLLAYVPPHRAPRVVRESGLTGSSGWITVDRGTMETAHRGVYALGDVVSIPLALGKPLPKAGVFAHGEAEVVARNIARAVTGRGEPATFTGHGACFIETGDGRAGYGAGNFYAEPVPEVRMRSPGRRWHLGKVLFEQAWLRGWV